MGEVLEEGANRITSYNVCYTKLLREMGEESENLKSRLLALGQMAAGLAHEIRNPIASIGVHCSILKSHLSKNEKLIASVNMIASEIAKVEEIISECLNFVRPAELGVRDVDVARLVSRNNFV